MTEKQIEVIADICPFYKEYGTCEQCNTALDIDGEPCYFECMANAIINNDYRKQSEWISVDERLPERMKTVLVCVKGYLKKPIMVVSEMLEENGSRWSACAGFTVTHWMPLPEAPKMKGGAE